MRYDAVMDTRIGAVCFDFDSTVVTKESLDLVIERALEEAPNRTELMTTVESITNASMNGQLPFTESLQRRFAVVPLTLAQFEAIGQILCDHITPGMVDVFAALAERKVSTFIISGGFRPCLLPVAERLGVAAERVIANEVFYAGDGAVTGIDTDSVCYSNHGKTPVIEQVRDRFSITGPIVMVGDGANDLQAYQNGAAEHFIGFTANVRRDLVVQNAPLIADCTSMLMSHLRTLLGVGQG
jgi:D-3-phosphoglycerate dehydrogenase